MTGVSPITVGLITWGAVTAVFCVLMGYRSLLSMREDDQIFLDRAESKLEEEQQQLLKKMARITPYTKGFGFASLGLLVLVAALWTYQAFTRTGMP
jgi:hypothetical protein